MYTLQTRHNFRPLNPCPGEGSPSKSLCNSFTRCAVDFKKGHQCEEHRAYFQPGTGISYTVPTRLFRTMGLEHPHNHPGKSPDQSD